MKKAWYLITLLLFVGNLITAPLCLVYHQNYNFSLGKVADKAVQLVHPIDGSRYEKMKKKIDAQVNSSDIQWVSPANPLSDEELCKAHTVDYLQSLRSSKTLSHIIDLDNLLSWMPAQTMYDTIITPQRWAAAGTVLAAHRALTNGMAINLGGGFHHAKADAGEGGCALADIPLAITALREMYGRMRVMVIDLDAHQGNGNASMLGNDPDMYLFDMYNPHVEPYEEQLVSAIDYPLSLKGGYLEEYWGVMPWIPYPCDRGVNTQEYMNILQEQLPYAIDEAIKRMGGIDLIVYNAGSDIYEEDPWGCLSVSAEGIAERDRYVFESASQRSIPIAMVLSGGYGQENAAIVSHSIVSLINTYAKEED